MTDQVVKAIDDDSFETAVLQSSKPVILDFWAEWCGPCKQIAPIFAECAKEYVGKVHFMKIDIQENKVVASKYNVRGIPTLMLFKEGKNVAVHVGGDLTKSALASFIDSNL